MANPTSFPDWQGISRKTPPRGRKSLVITRLYMGTKNTSWPDWQMSSQPQQQVADKHGISRPRVTKLSKFDNKVTSEPLQSQALSAQKNKISPAAGSLEGLGGLVNIVNNGPAESKRGHPPPSLKTGMPPQNKVSQPWLETGYLVLLQSQNCIQLGWGHAIFLCPSIKQDLI